MTLAPDWKKPYFELVGDESGDGGMTLDEAYVFLTGADRLTSEAPRVVVAAATEVRIPRVVLPACDQRSGGEVVTAAGEIHTGAMIALAPTTEDARRLALDGFEEPEQLHVTLVYLGEAADLDEEARAAILDVVRRYATTPLTARAFAANLFNPDGDEPCLVLGIGNDGGEELTELRSNVYSAVRGLAGVDVSENHVPWIPHITLAYADVVSLLAALPRALERVGPVSFDRVRVAFGGEVTNMSLRAPRIVVAASDHWKRQPRDPTGEDAGQWVKTPGGGAVTDTFDKLKKAIPAVIYKKHSDGTVVARSRDGQEISYDAGANAYVLKSEDGSSKKLTKKAAYDELKNVGKWAQPDSAAVSKAKSKKTTVPKVAAPKVIAPETSESKTPETPAAESPKVKKTVNSVQLTKQIDDLSKKIAQLTEASRKHRDVVQAMTHKAGQGKVLTKKDQDANYDAQDASAILTAEAREYADEKLRLLVERDGAPWGGDAGKVPTEKPVATALSSEFAQTRHKYVVNDRLTVANNELLRGDNPTPAAKTWRTQMNKMVNSTKIINDSVVYRGAVLPPELVMKLRSGATLVDKGIISTDEDRSIADFYADTRAEYIPGMIKTMFQIKVSKGTPGVDVGYGEFVFGTDSTLRILESKLVDGEVQVTAELIPASQVKGKKT